MRAERREVVLVQLGRAGRAPSASTAKRSSAARSSPVDARDLHERGRVAGQRSRVDHGVASSGVGSTSSAASVLMRRTALVSARA